MIRITVEYPVCSRRWIV